MALGGPMSGRCKFRAAGAPAAAVTIVIKSCVRASGIGRPGRIGPVREPVDEFVNYPSGGSPYLVGAVSVIVDVVGNVVSRADFGAMYGVVQQRAEWHFD